MTSNPLKGRPLITIPSDSHPRVFKVVVRGDEAIRMLASSPSLIVAGLERIRATPVVFFVSPKTDEDIKWFEQRIIIGDIEIQDVTDKAWSI